MFVIVDCRDSFIHNVAAEVASAGEDVEVVDEARCDPDVLRRMGPDAVILSPGPGRPSPDRGSWRVLDEFVEELPVLGICLGHQTICSYFGMKVDEGKGPMHGKVVGISHDGLGLFEGIPDGFGAVRYNSLCADPGTVPDCLRVDAVDARGDIMAVSHRSLPVFGVQFHPESFLTEHGHDIIGNFIKEVRRRSCRDTFHPSRSTHPWTAGTRSSSIHPCRTVSAGGRT